MSCLQAAGPDHAEEHPGHQGPVRDPQQQGEHLRLDAGHTYCYSICSVKYKLVLCCVSYDYCNLIDLGCAG